MKKYIVGWLEEEEEGKEGKVKVGGTVGATQMKGPSLLCADIVYTHKEVLNGIMNHSLSYSPPSLTPHKTGNNILS